MSLKLTAKHFIYVLKDPRDGTPRYVGCCTNTRARLIAHKSSRALRCLKEWLDELRSLDLLPVLEVLAEAEGCFAALDREKLEISRHIAMWGDKILNKNCRVHPLEKNMGALVPAGDAVVTQYSVAALCQKCAVHKPPDEKEAAKWEDVFKKYARVCK